MKTIKSIKLIISAIGAYFSARLGILFPILMILLGAMITDYITGMIKAGYKNEIESKKGMWGAIKKALYGVVVAVAMTADWVIINITSNIGIDIPLTTFFGLLVAVWLIFNELVSIIENLIILEVPLPGFLKTFVSKFKVAVEDQGNKIVDNLK